MNERYSIGMFAKMTGVTIRTLHYYDEIGILKPDVMASGRRFYEDRHFIPLQKIVTLKFLGFSLEQIKDLINKENWNLKESLAFQKKALLQKRSHIDQTIKALDHAFNLVADDGTVDSSIFISIIHGIQLEEDHKEWMKNVFSEEKIEAIFDIPHEKQLQLEKQWALLLTELKSICGSEPEGEEAQVLIKELFTLFKEVIGEDTSFVLQMMKTDLTDDQSHIPLPFSKEEEEWLAKALKFYLKTEGIELEES
jgi:DNA-binding transcriptional MerR regulator